MTIRADRTLEDRARFGLGSDSQDDDTDPAEDEIALTAEGVIEGTEIEDPTLTTELVFTATSVSELSDALADHIETSSVDDEAASFRPQYNNLVADSADVNASTTLVESGLRVDLVPGTYVVDAVVLATTASAADISLKWGGTATVTATVGVSDMSYVAGPHSGSDGTVAAIPVLFPTSWATETEAMFATTGDLADTPLIFKGRLVVTGAGTLTLQFTQGTNNGSNTHIDKGSYLVAQRVA